MARTVKKEWIGKTPDSMPGDRVRQRIRDAAKGLCHICGGKIDGKKWHADHVPPLKDGGENRESKMKPAHEICHRKLTAQQAIERAPIERQKMKHSGASRPKGTIPQRPKVERVGKMPLPPRRMYELWQSQESGD